MAAPDAPLDTIAHAPVAALGGQWSVLARQRADHRRLSELVEQVRSTRGEEQDEVLTRLCRLVFPHAFAEEAVLFPAARRILPEGDPLTEHIETEHQEINEVWSAVERSRHGDPDRDALLERAFALLDEDVRDEEDELLPRLRAALDDRELRRLGRVWELTRRVSPTRAHPVVSRRPPGQTLSALPLSALDRSRDAADRIARAAPEPVAASSRALSRGLAAVAGVVEHLPPFPSGERASTHTARTDVEER